MCTYDTTVLAVEGSAKGTPEWIRVSRATVYFDHPVHAPAAHTLNIDLADPDQGPAARIALELDARAAARLAGAILASLAALPPGLIEPGLIEPDVIEGVPARAGSSAV